MLLIGSLASRMDPAESKSDLPHRKVVDTTFVSACCLPNPTCTVPSVLSHAFRFCLTTCHVSKRHLSAFHPLIKREVYVVVYCERTLKLDGLRKRLCTITGSTGSSCQGRKFPVTSWNASSSLVYGSMWCFLGVNLLWLLLSSCVPCSCFHIARRDWGQGVCSRCLYRGQPLLAIPYPMDEEKVRMVERTQYKSLLFSK